MLLACSCLGTVPLARGAILGKMSNLGRSGISRCDNLCDKPKLRLCHTVIGRVARPLARAWAWALVLIALPTIDLFPTCLGDEIPAPGIHSSSSSYSALTTQPSTGSRKGNQPSTIDNSSATRNRSATGHSKTPRPAGAGVVDEAHAISTDVTEVNSAFLDSGAIEMVRHPITFADFTEVSACDACGSGDHCDTSLACGPAPHHFLLDWSRSDLWVGVTSFSNPSNFLSGAASDDDQVEGIFGFQQGFNFGNRIPSLLAGQVGSQVGMRFVQGSLNGSGLTDKERNQFFATLGLFRRVDYGVQGGLVVDYLRDQWLYESNLVQLRGELSFLFSPIHEVGFRFTDSLRESTDTALLPSSATSVAVRLSALETFRIYGRRRFGTNCGGLVELHIGSSQDGGTLLGGQLQNPLSGQLGLETSATFFTPKSSTQEAFSREVWNLSMAIVWTPGRLFGAQRDYDRPLFEVAGNGSVIPKHR